MHAPVSSSRCRGTCGCPSVPSPSSMPAWFPGTVRLPQRNTPPLPPSLEKACHGNHRERALAASVTGGAIAGGQSSSALGTTPAVASHGLHAPPSRLQVPSRRGSSTQRPSSPSPPSPHPSGRPRQGGWGREVARPGGGATHRRPARGPGDSKTASGGSAVLVPPPQSASQAADPDAAPRSGTQADDEAPMPSDPSLPAWLGQQQQVEQENQQTEHTQQQEQAHKQRQPQQQLQQQQQEEEWRRAAAAAAANAAIAGGRVVGARSPAPPVSGVLPHDGPCQDLLCDHLIRKGVLTSATVASAMRQVDRGHYVSVPLLPRGAVYEDHPIPIGHGQTISAPSMHAYCLELLLDNLRPGARVMDVGAGSGYLTACMAIMVGCSGYVLGVEQQQQLAQQAEAHIKAGNPELWRWGTVQLRAGNVLAAGALDNEAPFDAIHVGAAAPRLPQALMAKLKPGGRMVIPVGPRDGNQVLTVVDATEKGQLLAWHACGVRYVPLLPPTSTLP